MRRVSVLLLAFSVVLMAACSQSPAAPSRSIGAAAPVTAAVSHEQAVPISGMVEGEVTYATPIAACGMRVPITISSTGTVSHMGDVVFSAQHCLRMMDGSIQSVQLVITAANGDQLRGSYVGSAVMAPVGGINEATATITFNGGTGRFADARGTALMTGQVRNDGMEDPSWPCQWQFEGTIIY